MSRLTSFAHDGLRFDVRDEGPEDGDVVLLLHGFPQTSSSWQHVAPLLHAQGLRTLAPDQRGYSPGARPPRRRDYTIERLVGDAAALAELTGGPVHVVGHDWGAAVAWMLAATRPDLVTSLTSVSVPHPGAMVRALRHRDQLAKSWYMGFFQLPLVPERVLSSPRRVRRLLRGGGMSRATVDRSIHEVVDGGALRYALNWYRAMPLGDRTLLGARVRVPTTHVWSDQDVALGREGADLTASYVEADYRLEVLHGISHWIPDEAPEVLAQIVLERIGAHREQSSG